MPDGTLDAALDAIHRGYQVVPIRPHLKKPLFGGWTNVTWDRETTREQFEERLKGWGFEPGDPFNIGIVLGPQSGHLVDVDIDYARAGRFKGLLPRTPARSGRPGSTDSHYWYIVEEGTTGLRSIDSIPSTRRYKLADQSTVTIEFRYDRGVQTVAPPSDWVPKDWDEQGQPPHLIEIRDWVREPWGGEDGPAHVNGRQLAVQVALVALLTVLLDNWPSSGSRHDAYLALAGALLRQADGVVHPFWEKHAGIVIRNLSTASRDDDGPDAREHETIPSTIKNIRDGKLIWGFPKLAEIIGDDQVDAARSLVQEIESMAGFQSRNATAGTATAPPQTPAGPPTSGSGSGTPGPASNPGSGAPSPGSGGDPGDGEGPEPTRKPEPGDDGEPMEAEGSWKSIDLDPYLSGEFKPIEPTILRRSDGRALIYPGKTNMLFAPSESGKTLVALYTCIERMQLGERVVYIDFEDSAVGTVERLRAMGASDDDIRTQFVYVRPDEPIAPMQRNRFGQANVTPAGESNAATFARLLEQVDPALIVADGMTSIYELHGLDPNAAVETAVITRWLESLIRGGRSTVLIIDHMSKRPSKGEMPTGSQHKVSMIQGTLLQVWPVNNRNPQKGAVGEVELHVLKDRNSEVRRYAAKARGATKAQLAARVTIDSTGHYPDGSEMTVVTVAAPTAADSSVTTNLITVDLDADARRLIAKQEEQDRMDRLFMSAFGGRAGVSLTGAELGLRLKRAWKTNGWSDTAFNLTRRRLLLTPDEGGPGWLVKSGGSRGPKVKYTSMIAFTGDDTADDKQSDAGDTGTGGTPGTTSNPGD